MSLVAGIACIEWDEVLGGPVMPVSFPFVSMKYLVAFRARVSISTSISSIMHAEYCFVPCEFNRDPCGMVQVGMRATSVIVSVDTTETDEGTMSPCRLKFTTKRKSPEGVTSIVAGK